MKLSEIDERGRMQDARWMHGFVNLIHVQK